MSIVHFFGINDTRIFLVIFFNLSPTEEACYNCNRDILKYIHNNLNSKKPCQKTRADTFFNARHLFTILLQPRRYSSNTMKIVHKCIRQVNEHAVCYWCLV